MEINNEVNLVKLRDRIYDKKCGCFCKTVCCPLRSLWKFLRRRTVKASEYPVTAQSIQNSQGAGLAKFISHALHSYDMFTDIYLAWTLYWLS